MLFLLVTYRIAHVYEIFTFPVVEMQEAPNGITNKLDSVEGSGRNSDSSVASVKRTSDDCQAGTNRNLAITESNAFLINLLNVFMNFEHLFQLVEKRNERGD